MSFPIGSPESVCRNHINNALEHIEHVGLREGRDNGSRETTRLLTHRRGRLRHSLSQIVAVHSQHPENTLLAEAANIATDGLKELPERPDFAFFPNILQRIHARLQLITLLVPESDRVLSHTNRISPYYKN